MELLVPSLATKSLEMLRCFTSGSSQSSSLATAENQNRTTVQGNSTASTPRSTAVPSPTFNLTNEYSQAVQTNSYREIWSRIHTVDEKEETGHVEHLHALATEILQPNRECVEEVLEHSASNPFINVLSTYFDHTERVSHLLLILRYGARHARSLYHPIEDVIDLLPDDSDNMNQRQCDWAFDIFLRFDGEENPFPSPGAHNLNEMHRCFSDLKEVVDGQLNKSRSRLRVIHRVSTGSAICFVGTVVGVAISAVAIAAHALVAVAAASVFPTFSASKITGREVAHVTQLDAAARSAYVLHNDLETINSLVGRVRTGIEDDKGLVSLVVSRGREKHLIHGVTKQLEKKHNNVLLQLTDLEEQICLCFTAINRARDLVLRTIDINQSYDAPAHPTSEVR